MENSKTAALPANRQPTLRLTPMPSDTNAAGDIFGGWMVSQIDIAGSIAAYRRARCHVVTVAINSVQFHEPTFVGDVISCYADVIKVGRTSLTVSVDVYAERISPQGLHVAKVTEATLTYVAIDENRKPKVVPPEGE